MGRVYARGGKLYLDYLDVAGERARQASGLAVGQEEAAAKQLADLEARVAANVKIAGPGGGPVTVAQYAKRWIKERVGRGVAAGRDEEGWLKRYVLPRIGDVPLAELGQRHVRDLVRGLHTVKSARKTPLAPRSIRHCYAALRQVLDDAEVEGLIRSNPCKLKKKRGELPGKVDADSAWRAGAVFTRGEAEAIISDERIPQDRRAVYALLFLAGVRFGGSAALRWRDYDQVVTPLGRLHVALSYDTKTRKVKATKTDRARQVPTHPTLAKVLAAWKLDGWERMIGRPPQADDLIVPSRLGANRNVNHALKRFHEDLDRLKLRRRRQHDARRTFISLALGDGARKDLLRWVTHGGSGDIIDQYTTPPWPALCEAVSCLRLDLREGHLVEFPALKAVAGGVDGSENRGTTERHNVGTASESTGTIAEDRRGGRDLNPRPPA